MNMKKLTFIALIGTVIMIASCKKQEAPLASRTFKYDNTNLKEIIHRASQSAYDRIYNHANGPITIVTVESGWLSPNPADFECHEPYNMLCAILITSELLTVDTTSNTVTTDTTLMTTDYYTQAQLDSALAVAQVANWDMNFIHPGHGTLILARPDAPQVIDVRRVVAHDTLTASGDSVKVIHYESH